MSGTGGRRILVRDLILPWDIGVFAHERGRKQRVRINLDLAVAADDQPLGDNLANTVSYAGIVDGIRALARNGRVNLVETLAERVAALCLADRRVLSVRARVEKLDVYPDAAVGVEIERFNQHG